MTLTQEAVFVANPNGSSEDEGVLLTIGYNFNEKRSSLVIIDSKTMETLGEWHLPFKLAGGFHASWWPTKEQEAIPENAV